MGENLLTSEERGETDLSTGDSESLSFECSYRHKRGSLLLQGSGFVWQSPSASSLVVVCQEVVTVQQGSLDKSKASSALNCLEYRDSPYGSGGGVLFVWECPSSRGHARLLEHRFSFEDHNECRQCHDALKSLLAALDRPKDLLVLINPYGGRGKGRPIYESRVSPLFHLAGIRTTVIVTQRANEAREYVQDHSNDLSSFDGIVSVGGDGMFAEVFEGLLFRVNGPVRPGQEVKPTGISIGIIPAGSTNAVCYGTTGHSDPVTSSLQIVLGHRLHIDAAAVFSEERLVAFSTCVMGYGFLGDVLVDSERKRWMGPTRYDVAGARTFLRGRQYEGRLTLYPAGADSGHPLDGRVCLADCSECSRVPSHGDPPPELQSECAKGPSERLADGAIRMTGPFLAINGTVMACRCRRTRHGLSPSNHLCSGTLDLIVTRSTSRARFLHHLFRCSQQGLRVLDFPFMQSFRVERFTFEPQTGVAPSVWNCDGEPLANTAVDVRVQRGIVSLFARGVNRST